MLSNHVMQMGTAMRPCGFTVGEQEIKGAEFSNAWCEFFQRMGEFLYRRQASVRFTQLLHQPAKRQFAVRGSYRLKMGVQMGLVVCKIAIVRKDPVPPP